MEVLWKIWDIITLNKVNISEEAITENIKSEFWIDISTEEWVKNLINIINSAINYYCDYLCLEIPTFLKTLLPLKSKEELIKFIIESQIWQFNLIILDISLSIKKIIDKNENCDFNDNIESFLSGLSLRDNNLSQCQKLETEWRILSWNREIKFNIKYRKKQTQSIVSKYIRTRSLSKACNDYFWFEIEIENEDDIIAFIRLVKKYFNNNWNIRFLNRWLVVNEQFIEMLKSELITSNIKYTEVVPSISWPGYKDIIIRIWDNIEIKFVLKWNENEFWYNNHQVREWLKKIELVLEIEWDVSMNYILKIAGDICAENWNLWITELDLYNYYCSHLYY